VPGSTQPSGEDGRSPDDSPDASGSAVDAGPTVPEPRNLWTRWDDDADALVHDEGLLPVADLHLHRYCTVWPTRDAEAAAVEAGSDRPRVQFLTGLARTGLQYTPAVVLVTLAVFLAGAELAPGVQGVSVFLPYLRPAHLLVLVGGGLLWLPMLYLVMDVGLVDRADLLQGVVVYGLLAVLSLGTVGSVVLVTTADDPTALPPNVIYTSGYLLMLLLCGLLVYDGMLRTETLFERIHEKLIVPDDREGGYRRFRDDVLAPRLGHATALLGREIPTCYPFAALFVVQFGAIWWLTRGPQGLDFSLTLAANVLLDLFVVAVAFQFLVLVKTFHELVTEEFPLAPGADGEGGEDGIRADAGDVDDAGSADDAGCADDAVGASADNRGELLRAVLFHPDGRGGFRDFGKFATRVNVLLIVGGLYTVYRLYVQGARVEPTAMAPGLDPSIGALLWVVSFVGPVVAYLVAAAAWLYYSFWQLHVKMARDRERAYLDFQLRRREAEAVDAEIGAPDDGTQWAEVRNAAPVWPIKNKQLLSVVTGSAAPLVLSLPKFLF